MEIGGDEMPSGGMSNDGMPSGGLSEEKWTELKTTGALYLPNVLDQNETRQWKEAVANLRKTLPYGFEYGEHYSRANPKKQEVEPVMDSAQVLTIFDAGFRDPSFHQIVTKPKIYDALERMLGQEFMLTNASLHTVRPKLGRLPIHKDSHGQAIVVVLIDDFGWDQGGTSVIPGTHINSPPPAFCLDDINARPEGEVQGTGEAGSAYIYYIDSWHGRSANLGTTPVTRLIMLFENRANLVAPAWLNCFSADEIAGAQSALPASVRHIITWTSDHENMRRKRLEAMNPLQRWVYNDGNIANDLFKNFVYLLMHSNRVQVADARGQHLLPGTHIPMLSEPFHFGIYWQRLKLKLVLRRYSGMLIRKFPGGSNLIRNLKRWMRNTNRAQ